MGEIQQGLLIAAIGMGLVFLVIVFLWGLMALMMRLTSRKIDDASLDGQLTSDEATLVPAMQAVETRRRAAAAAVAVALAVNARQSANKQKDSEGENRGGLSTWQVFHRSRQMENEKQQGWCHEN